MKTFSARKEDMQPKWYVIDAKGQPLGRVAVKAANLLRGKEKPIFTPHIDTGDYVVVLNAKEVVLTGRKEEQKIYTRVSGFVGGQKRETPAEVRKKHPERLVERAVRGMIPHNRLGRQIYAKLRVYAGDEHPHAASQPEAVALA